MRHEFSRKTKRQAWERSEGLCENVRDGVRCCAPLERGRFVYEHLDPDFISGLNTLANCALFCVPCAKEKTRKDQKDIAKIKRIRDKQVKAKTARRPMPFGRHDRYKRKMNGQIVERPGWFRGRDHGHR